MSNLTLISLVLKFTLVILKLQEESEEMDTLCRYLLHGNGHSCWFDKSFSAYIFKNGRVRYCYLHFCTEFLFWLFVFLLIFVD